MARSFKNLRAVSDILTKAMNCSKGYASASAPATSTQRVGAAKMVKRARNEENPRAGVSWVPDPRTGFYRPENVAEEIDVAELRAAVLKKH